VVSVTQFYDTLPETRKKKPLFAIGFAVYEVPHATARLTPQFVAEQVGPYQKTRWRTKPSELNLLHGQEIF
jgi:hypothetical protein